MFLAAPTLTSKLHQCESYLIRYFFWNRAGSGKTPQDPVGPMPFAMQTEYELEEHHEGYWEFRKQALSESSDVPWQEWTKFAF